MNVAPLIAVCALAQANTNIPDYDVQPASPPVTEKHASEDKPKDSAKICSLNVPDMELAKVVRILADQTKTNIMLMSKPDARLTIRLVDVPLSSMLRHICAISGLAMLQVEDTYVLATEDQLKAGYPEAWEAAHPTKPVAKQDLVTQSVLLKYVKAGQMAKALTTLYPSDILSVIVGPEQKSPSLQDQQIKLTDSNAGMLGGDQRNGKIEAGSVEAESNARAIMLRGPKDVIEAALNTVKLLDVARPQVSIAVTVHEVTNEAVKELGLSWSFSNIIVQDRRVSSSSGGTGSGTTVDRGGAFDPLSATATIKALETANKARLLASPTISVLDGERGYVLIGDRIKYPVVTTFSQANTPIFDVREDRVGIYLQVAANVSTDNEITLSLYPQVSTITGFLNVNGASYPQISTREAQTTLRLKSGETVVMAGLLRDDQVENIAKVPILGDLPILGELFKLRKKSKTGSQLVITITPLIIGEKTP